MSWSVRLQDEKGAPVLPYEAAIEFQTVPSNGSFTLLHYLDPYGDTYFNHVQMSDFLGDWDSLRPEAAERQQWTVVRDMAVRCQNEPHLYLRFIGD